MSWTLVANFGSFDSLKVFTRCGFSPCAAQIRWTLRWLIPAALAIPPAGPVRRFTRRPSQRHLDDPFHRCRCQRRLATRTRRVAEQPINALDHKARLPAPDRRLAFAGLPMNFHRADPR